MTSEKFGAAYESGYISTVRFLISRGATTEEAKEIAQAAWARGWERREQLRSDAAVLRWVNSIAKNFQRSGRRSQSKYPTVEISSKERELAAPEAVKLAEVDVIRILQRCPSEYRKVWTARAEGFTQEEIAERIGKTKAAVRGIDYRTRCRVRLEFAPKATPANQRAARRRAARKG